MDYRPQAWGRPRDDVYGPYDSSYLHAAGPNQATQSPIVTGTSVIALKFRDGVVMAADNLASYGSLARFPDVKRLRPFTGTSVVGFSGDVSDMQHLDRILDGLAIKEEYTRTPSPPGAAGASVLNAANLHKYLSKLLYARRNKFNPLWNQVLVCGFDADEKPFLASVDLRGTTFTGPSLATGYGSMLALPIMRRVAGSEADAEKLGREEAVNVVRECMKVLFYRDARSLDTYSLAVVTREGVESLEGEKLQGQIWQFAERIHGYGTQTV